MTRLNKYQFYYDLVKEYPIESVLDLGCWKRHMKKFFRQYKGVDRSEGTDIDNYTISNKVDLVIATEILEHLQYPHRVMNSIKKSSKFVLIALPNDYNIMARLRFLFGHTIDEKSFTPYKHLHYPTLRQSKEFVSSYFTILKTRFWSEPGIIARLLGNAFPSLFARMIVFVCKV